MGILQLFLDPPEIEVHGIVHTESFQEMRAQDGHCFVPARRLHEAEGTEEPGEEDVQEILRPPCCVRSPSTHLNSIYNVHTNRTSEVTLKPFKSYVSHPSLLPFALKFTLVAL